MTTRWKDDPTRVEKANAGLDECFSGPWGDKASEEDVVWSVAHALGLSADFGTTRDEYAPLAEALYEWEGGNESPLVAGLSQMITDGLQPGATVPVEEVAGELETASWEARQTAFILDLLQDHYEKEGKS